MNQEHTFVVILAGGSGTRLWPRSRRANPKHLLDLITNQSMLRDTFERIRPLVEPDHILVVTGANQADRVRQQLPELAPENVIAEPEGRNTGPAIGLAAVHLLHRDPEAVMMSLHSDHYIRDAEGFCRALAAAGDLACQGYLVTLGIQPTQAETGYGYIHRDEPLGEVRGWTAFRVGRFVEKPSAPVAERMVASGEYYWNAGIFIWRVGTLLEAFARFQPSLYGQLEQIGKTLEDPQARPTFEEVWSNLPKVAIDTAIMEKADQVAVIPIDVGWSDVGSWRTLQELAAGDDHRNVLIGDHICLETTSTYIYSPKKLVAVVGLSDLIVVDTGDALLICPRDRAQQVKDVVDELGRQKKDQYL